MTPEISFKVVVFGQTVKKHYTFIFFRACEREESSKSYNLIGSESGRYFTILPANPFVNEQKPSFSRWHSRCTVPAPGGRQIVAVSFERPLITLRPRARSYVSRERKLWWKKFKIKLFASGYDKIWDSHEKHRRERQISDRSFDGNFG